MMFKHTALLVRKAGMSHEDFVEHWQTTHTPIARDIEGVVRYNQVLPTEPEHAEFDGLAELYFESLEDLHAALGSEGSRDYDPTREVATRAREDVDNFLAVDERPRFIGRERVVKDTVDTSDGLYKHSAFLVRKAGMSHEEFVEHWQTTHTPIARDIEGVVKYNQVLPTEPERAEFDGLAELYFENLSDLYAALGSEGSRDYDPDRGTAKEAREDVDNFLAIDERPRFIGQERVVKDET
jgi:uncharacterized protein (TIGR02118 family)